MLLEASIGASIAIVSGVTGFFVAKRITNANFEVYEIQARAKAKAIENEAEIALKKSLVRAEEITLEAGKRLSSQEKALIKEFEHKALQLKSKESRLLDEIENKRYALEEESSNLARQKDQIKQGFLALDREEEMFQRKLLESEKILEAGSGLTRNEARQKLFQRIEERERSNIAHIIRKYESEAKEEGIKRANYIISQATTRIASDFSQERLVNIVSLPDDELKGRIIGKEGRNIKTLENLMGVDIIIDDTPNTITISNFNLYRRAIATRTMEALIEDGRIQPSRIEEIYEKVTDEFEEGILKEGEEVVSSLGLSGIHTELIKLVGRLKYRASYGQNALSHSLEVAHLAGVMAAELGGDEQLAKRAGLLHDIGKALTVEQGGSHVDLGVQVCQRYKEDPVVINAIYAHHGYEEAKTIESAVVCTADALSAARPGARREVLESFLKRVEQIEEIAMKNRGVKTAYAINAGRELRVIVNAELINDDSATMLAREIAKEVQQNVQYPGEVKINVIREKRAVEYAR
jgi:ribonuclease Y